MHHAQKTEGETYARSIEEAARCMGVGKSTLYEFIAAGKLRSFRIGRRVLIAESEIRRFLAERMEAAA